MYSMLKDIYDCLKSTLASVHSRYFIRKTNWGRIGQKSFILKPSLVSGKENIYLEDNVHIDWNNVIYATKGTFIMKKDSGAAVGLTVVTDNHSTVVGETVSDRGNENLIAGEVIVEEDVWIAANVTLLSNTVIGRGCIVGAGAVVRGQKIPPYAIIVGNPAKIVGFRFTPEEILQHELVRYTESERLSYSVLVKNYEKFFLQRMGEIKEFLRK